MNEEGETWITGLKLLALKNPNTVNPYLQRLRTPNPNLAATCHIFTASGSFPLFYREWSSYMSASAKRIIICAHGMHSHGEKFILLADTLINHDWIVIALDFRNHGLSWKKFKDRGDVDNFSLWIDDFKEFLLHISRTYPGIPISIIAESMGAAVAILSILEMPNWVKSIVMISPALKPWAVAEVQMVQKAFRYSLLGGVEKQRIRDTARGRYSTNTKEYIEYLLNDLLRLDSVSPRYYFQIIKMTHQLRPMTFAGFLPSCVFFGGRDVIIDFNGVKEFISRLGTEDKALFYIPRAHHDLLADPWAKRYGLIKKICQWFTIY